jgi:hypothetical protein
MTDKAGSPMNRPVFHLDRALRFGKRLPTGISVEYMASDDSVEVGTAESDFDFLDGRWVDVRSTPDIAKLFPETVLSFDNAELSFHGAIRLADGTRIASALFKSRPAIFDEVDERVNERIAGANVSVAQNASGFGHWLLQRLGRIYTAHDHAPGVPLILTELRHRGDDFLTRVGYDPAAVRRLTRIPEKSWTVDKLLVPSYSGVDLGRVADSRRYRRDMDRLLHGIDVTTGLSAYPERVFLGRRSESSMREGMANAIEIERIFIEHGYEFVDHARLPFDEQVRVIRAAKFIAGESGSAAQNAMFGARGLTVVVVTANNGVRHTPYTPGQKTYGRMATDALKLNFRRINASPHPRTTGWVADPDIVRRALASMPGG